MKFFGDMVNHMHSPSKSKLSPISTTQFSVVLVSSKISFVADNKLNNFSLNSSISCLGFPSFIASSIVFSKLEILKCCTLTLVNTSLGVSYLPLALHIDGVLGTILYYVTILYYYKWT